MGDNIAISDEANAALQEWMDARKNWNDCGCEGRFRDAETTLSWMTQDPTHFRQSSDFDLKDFNALEDAYAMAYNDGHRDGRNRAAYAPSVVKIDRETFREAYKMRAEDSFEAQRQPPWSAANPMPNRIIECGECDAKGVVQGRECSKCDGVGFWKIMSPKCAICDDWIAGRVGAECDECNKWYCDAHYDIDNNSCVVCGDPMTDSQSMMKHSEDHANELAIIGEKCDNERSFLISILSDRQLDEFLEFEEDSYSAEETFESPVSCKICGKTFASFRGLNGHMNAHLPAHRKRAETKLGKDSCCCGATKTNPCQCMVEGLKCSSTCPCSCGQKNADTEANPQETMDNEGGAIRSQPDDEWNCVLCGHKSKGYGHNPDPVALTGRCCDTCNARIVIPNRMMHQHMWQRKKADYIVDVGGPYGAHYTGTIKEVKKAEEGCSCPVCGTNTEVIREHFDDDTSWVDLVVCDNCCWMEELEDNEEAYDDYMKHLIAMLDEEPDADLLEKPNVEVDTSWDWSDGVGPPPSQQTLDITYDAEGDQFPSMHYGDYDSDAQEKYQEFVDEWDGDNDPPSFEEWYKGDEYHEGWPNCASCNNPIPKDEYGEPDDVGDGTGRGSCCACVYCYEEMCSGDCDAKSIYHAEGDELTDEEKQEGWNIFQEEAASIEDPNLEKIKALADKHLTDIISDDSPMFFVDPGLEDYYQFILTDPTYSDGGEPEDAETAAMFEELKQVRYWATILTDRHIEEADNAAKAMIAAAIMSEDKELFDQGMLGLETNNQVQRERELLAQWLAEGGVHGN